MDKIFSSVEEIDKELEDEFSIKDDELEDEDEDEEDFEEEESEEEDSQDEPQPPAKKPSKEEQQSFAYAKLREEKVAAERKASEEADFFKKLAKASGYGDDVSTYRNDLEKRIIEEEAKAKGVSPEAFKELEDTKAKLAKYETTKAEEERLNRSQTFLKTVNKVIKNYDLEPKETSKELFANLEKAGFTVDMLLAIPNPEYIIKGVLFEQLAKSETKETRIKNGVETRRIKSSGKTPKTIDDLVEEEVAAYAKSRGMKYVK
jgi:hypothetical protein